MFSKLLPQWRGCSQSCFGEVWLSRAGCPIRCWHTSLISISGLYWRTSDWDGRDSSCLLECYGPSWQSPCEVLWSREGSSYAANDKVLSSEFCETCGKLGGYQQRSTCLALGEWTAQALSPCSSSSLLVSSSAKLSIWVAGKEKHTRGPPLYHKGVLMGFFSTVKLIP